MPAPVEAPPGFEPGIRVLQTHALPLGYGAGVARPVAASDAGGREAEGLTRGPAPVNRVASYEDGVCGGCG